MTNTYSISIRSSRQGRQASCNANHIPGRAARLSRIREERRRQQNIRRVKLMGVFALLVVTMFVTLSGFTAPGNSSRAEYKYYKAVEVEGGDTLWNIACRNISGDYSVKSLIMEIQDVNNIGDHIHSGQIIMVPYYSDDIR